MAFSGRDGSMTVLAREEVAIHPLHQAIQHIACSMGSGKIVRVGKGGQRVAYYICSEVRPP